MFILSYVHRGRHRAPRLSSAQLAALILSSATVSVTASAAGVALTLAGAR